MMCDGGQPACNRGNGGQSRYTLFHWAPLAEAVTSVRTQAQNSRPSHLEPRNCQAHMQLPSTSVWQMAAHPVPDPIDSSRHDSFSGEPDPEPIPQVTSSCAWLILDPSYLLALAGSGLRLSFLLASSSITCIRTLGTTDVALPIGSLLDESPPAEVIH